MVPEDLGRRLPRHQDGGTGVYAGDGFVVVEYTGRGTHEGTLRSSAGDIPLTSRPVEMRFCNVHYVRDGEISRYHSYFDLAGMLI